MALLIENGKVLQPNYSFKEQTIAIDDNIITSLGSKEKMRGKYKRYDRIDASDSVVLPGFINAHTHAALGLAKGFGVGIPLFEMFEKVLFPLYKKMSDEKAYLGALVAGLEFIHTGSTSFNNIDSKWSKPVLKAFDRLGLRGTMALALKDREVKTSATFDCKGLSENEWLVKRLRDHKLIKGMYGLANEFEATEGLIKQVRELAAQDNTGVHLHLAESKSETGFILQKTGKSSTRYLYDLGVLNENSLAVHAVNVTKKDIPILAKSRVTVVHCPTSNLNMNSGTASVNEMFDAGVSMSVGVDHPIVNMSNDVRRELRTANIIQRTRGNVLPLKSLLSMAFNSRLYGYANGALSQGSLADLVVVSMKGSVVPQDNDSLLRETFFANSPVTHSIINGNIVMRDSRITTVNEKNTLKKAQAACKF